MAAIVEGIHGVVVSEQPDSAVVLELPADRLPLFIDGDSTRLEQVIWNLLNNALKFSPPGSAIRLSLSHDDTQVSLSVIDQGIGLTADSLEHIFDLFSQAASPLGHAAREGLGIGLSLVRQLVEAHGGSVSAYSAGLGQGCTFTVTLPLSQSGRGEQLACQQPERMGRLDGLHVLLVDDSPEVLDVMQQLLEMECAQVSAFADPRQALEVARDTKYDVILSDIGMPVMDGHALIKALRNMKHLQHTPAIALTGYGASADQHRSKQSGFDRHLNKPVGYDELVEAIESLHDSVLY